MVCRELVEFFEQQYKDLLKKSICFMSSRDFTFGGCVFCKIIRSIHTELNHEEGRGRIEKNIIFINYEFYDEYVKERSEYSEKRGGSSNLATQDFLYLNLC